MKRRVLRELGLDDWAVWATPLLRGRGKAPAPTGDGGQGVGAKQELRPAPQERQEAQDTPEGAASNDGPVAGTLRVLAEQVAGCEKCGLCKSRTQAVFGQGNEDQGMVMVIGEGPGEEEDRQGLPFVGKSGRLLDNMLASIGLSRDSNAYITNIVKCRPPENRNPAPEEVEACLPHLFRQIDLLGPRLVIVAGKVAGNALISAGAPIGGMRGTVHDIRGVPAIATYHPAYYLRSPLEKRKGWEDLLLIKRTLAELPAAKRPAPA